MIRGAASITGNTAIRCGRSVRLRRAWMARISEDPIQVMFTGGCVRMRAAQETLHKMKGAGEFSLALADYPARDLAILDVLNRGVTQGRGAGGLGVQPGHGARASDGDRR